MLKGGSGVTVISEKGDMNEGYRLSVALRFKPKVVRSDPSARAFESYHIDITILKYYKFKEYNSC